MTENGLISIIVPVYNIRDYVEKCICSLMRQTYSDLEIILVDDGSTDGSGEICDQYMQKDGRIKVYHKKNGGLSDARNYGLDRMTGTYLAFVDGDDWVHPQMYESLLYVIQKEQADLVCCDYEREDESFAKKNIDMKNIQYNAFSREQIIADITIAKTMACNKLYRAKIFAGIRYPYGKLHEDEYVIHEIIWQCKKIIAVQQAMYFYTVRDVSIAAKLTPKRIEDALAGLEERIQFMVEHCPKEGLAAAVNYYCCYTIYTFYRIDDDGEEIGDEWKDKLWRAEKAVVQKYRGVNILTQYKKFAKSQRTYERWRRRKTRGDRYIQLLIDIKHRGLFTLVTFYDKICRKVSQKTGLKAVDEIREEKNNEGSE